APHGTTVAARRAVRIGHKRSRLLAHGGRRCLQRPSPASARRPGPVVSPMSGGYDGDASATPHTGKMPVPHSPVADAAVAVEDDLGQFLLEGVLLDLFLVDLDAQARALVGTHDATLFLDSETLFDD